MRVLVCGGRDFSDWVLLNAILNALTPKPTLLIHGAATGADRLAYAWAREHSIDIEAYPAHWTLHGKAAGPIRNRQMLEQGKPDLVVAFPGGKGTADMIDQARKAGVQVVHVPAESEL